METETADSQKVNGSTDESKLIENITVERMFEPYFGDEFDNWHDDYDNSSFMIDS